MSRLFRLIYPAPLLVRVRSSQCCNYLQRVMKIVGWMPPPQGLQRYIYLSWSCLIFGLAECYLPFGFALSLVNNFKVFTPGEFLGIVNILLTAVSASTKAFTFTMFLGRLRATQSLLDEMDERLSSVQDRWTIHKAVARSNYIFMIYFFIFFAYALSAFLAGVLNAQPGWMIYNPLFDWRDGTVRLWLQMLLEYFICLNGTTINLICDTYPLILIIMFRSYVDVLKDHIRQLRTDPLKTEAENYDELVACIVYHKLILKCCDQLRPVITITFFVQFLMIGAVLGLNLINVLYFSDIFRAISSVVFVTAILLESFPFCYLCDLLVEDSGELSLLLSQSHWIEAELRYKSTLRIFMQHVQQPIKFVAGGTFPISMVSNIKMAKFAFSVMTLVQTLNLADQFQ